MTTSFVALATLGSVHSWRTNTPVKVSPQIQAVATKKSFPRISSRDMNPRLRQTRPKSQALIKAVTETPEISQVVQQPQSGQSPPSVPVDGQDSITKQHTLGLSVTPVSAQPARGWTTQGYLDGSTSTSVTYELPAGPAGRSLSFSTDKAARVLLNGCGTSSVRNAPLTMVITGDACSLKISVDGTENFGFTISTQGAP
ncbi:MAG: hypothetical protein WCO31_00710 [Actinomycetes bacterium]